MNPLLTICSINFNSSDFLINTLYCLEKITKNTYKVIIRDNNSNIKDFSNLERKIHKYLNVELYRVENFNYTGSLAHGIAINDLVNKIDTKYGVILDADCTFLYKDWDEILINKINGEYPIIGTQPPIGGTSKKPGDFPLMFAILFDTKILKELKIDFRPNKQVDTGYQLRNKFLENGYKGKLLLFKNTREYKLGPFRNILCSEYYLNGYDGIFASHFGRGSSLGMAKYLKGWKKRIYNFPIFGSYLLKTKGKRERKNGLKYVKHL